MLSKGVVAERGERAPLYSSPRNNCTSPSVYHFLSILLFGFSLFIGLGLLSSFVIHPIMLPTFVFYCLIEFPYAGKKFCLPVNQCPSKWLQRTTFPVSSSFCLFARLPNNFWSASAMCPLGLLATSRQCCNFLLLLSFKRNLI